mmetsp:Transcript_46975/g.75687  ORF Transcript_46975/g.75687 Transcript_46975/m.75687 type:complete len:88 (+) Transcript_46975:56-319(+)
MYISPSRIMSLSVSHKEVEWHRGMKWHGNDSTDLIMVRFLTNTSPLSEVLAVLCSSVRGERSTSRSSSSPPAPDLNFPTAGVQFHLS